MRLLLDEYVDQRLRAELHGHEVKTVAEMGWSNFKDGELLSVAQHEFDTLITVDRNLPYQQHLPKFRLAVMILHARTNRLVDLACAACAGCFAHCPRRRSNDYTILKLQPI